MRASRPLRLAPEWDDRFARMVVLSAIGHAFFVTVALLIAERAGPRPLPMVAYTVELTDPSALGGRTPPGAPAPDLAGGPVAPPAPAPKGEAAEPPKPPEPAPEAKAEPPKPPEPEPPKREEPVVRLPEKPPEKPPEPKPEPKKPEPPKPEAKKPEPPKPEPPKKEPPKQEVASEKPAPAKPEAKPAGPPSTAKAGTPTGAEEAPPRDAYSAAAERWRTRGGGGLGGSDTGSGPIGAGGQGPGGGGQLVGLEFIAYRQQVINTIKAQWTNVIARPGLVAAVRFEIAPDGEVSNVRLAQGSGNSAYDASAMRAVQHTSRLPPPPARYASEFREFQIEFHSEETGGRGTG